MSDALFKEMQKITEAWAIQRGIPINRLYTDAELIEAHAQVAIAKAKLSSMEEASK